MTATPCGADFDLSWAPGARPRTIGVGPDRLFALELGDGPAVVLLHGYTCELTHFRYQLPALAEAGFRAIAVDLPGHGHASKPRGRYPAERFIAAALGVLDQLVLERASLVGHSMGGAIALALAQRFPARVDRVALISPYVDGLQLGAAFGAWVKRIAPLPLLPALLLRLQTRGAFEASLAHAVLDLGPVRTEDGGRWKDYAWEMSRLPGMRAVVRAAGRDLVRSWRAALPELPRLGARGLLLWGEQDDIVKHAGAAALAGRLEAPLISLAGCSHCAHFEKPAEVNQALLRLLRADVAQRTPAH